MEATAFQKTVVDRELAQRDLTQWIQQAAATAQISLSLSLSLYI